MASPVARYYDRLLDEDREAARSAVGGHFCPGCGEIIVGDADSYCLDCWPPGDDERRLADLRDEIKDPEDDCDAALDAARDRE